MKIESKRFEYGGSYTISKLYIDGALQCYVLEDVVRDPGTKVFGQTAIPAGTYKVVVDFSPHMQKVLPRLLDVPGFEGIRIHSGNTDADTEGCLLLGTAWPGGNLITGSRIAFAKVFPQIQAAWDKKDPITITITDTR